MQFFFSNSNFLAPKLLLLLLVNKYTGMNIYTCTSVVMFHMIIEFDPIHSWLQMKILFGYQRLHDFWTLKAEIEVVLKLFSSFYSGGPIEETSSIWRNTIKMLLFWPFYAALKSLHFFLSIYQEASTQLFKNKVISQDFFKRSGFLKLLLLL